MKAPGPSSARLALCQLSWSINPRSLWMLLLAMDSVKIQYAHIKFSQQPLYICRLQRGSGKSGIGTDLFVFSWWHLVCLMQDKKHIALVQKADSCSQVSNDEVVLRENGTLHHSLKVSYILGKFYYFLLLLSLFLFLFCLKMGGVL